MMRRGCGIPEPHANNAVSNCRIALQERDIKISLCCLVVGTVPEMTCTEVGDNGLCCLVVGTVPEMTCKEVGDNVG